MRVRSVTGWLELQVRLCAGMTALATPQPAATQAVCEALGAALHSQSQLAACRLPGQTALM